MKYAIIIPDGCADEPQDSLGGKTPLQAARLPNMDRIARMGVVGRSNNVPRPLTPASDVATLSLFGYDPDGDHFRLTREMGGRRVNLAVVHAEDQAGAEELLSQAQQAMDCHRTIVCRLATSLVTNLGTGTLGIVVYPVDP